MTGLFHSSSVFPLGATVYVQKEEQKTFTFSQSFYRAKIQLNDATEKEKEKASNFINK